ncbi:MAG: hypothetical protein ACRYG8_22810 [Janthinobacterium lividum]
MILDRLRLALQHRGVRASLLFWIIGTALVLLLAHGSLPFDRPSLAGLPFAVQMAVPTIGMVEILGLIGLTLFLTRHRTIPDMAARAPARRIAARETMLLLLYAAAGQVGGWILGPALGYRPFGFHVAGSIFGSSMMPPAGEVCCWALYNFTVFAVVPMMLFRLRYDATQLNLRSTNRVSDLRLILAVGAVESGFTLLTLGPAMMNLSTRQWLIGAPVTFVVFFLGTVLPTMVLIYAILLPRYLKLTGSPVSAAVLGGLTYASMHVVEGWSRFDSPRDTVLSLALVLFTYFGPGVIKSILTLRTGNAWVHALGYHAIAPHTIMDTPLIVNAFHIV